MSTEEILAAIGRLSELSPEAQDLLKHDEATLEALLQRVKRDQVKLSQFVPPMGTSTGLHELALATLDLETSVLISLLNVYSSRTLARIGPELEELATRFNQAKAELVRAVDTWAEATTTLNIPQSPD